MHSMIEPQKNSPSRRLTHSIRSCHYAWDTNGVHVKSKNPGVDFTGVLDVVLGIDYQADV